jgi:hypothetical protein
MKIKVKSVSQYRPGFSIDFEVEASHGEWTQTFSVEIRPEHIPRQIDTKEFYQKELIKSAWTEYEKFLKEKEFLNIARSMKGKEVPQEIILVDRLEKKPIDEAESQPS